MLIRQIFWWWKVDTPDSCVLVGLADTSGNLTMAATITTISKLEPNIQVYTYCYYVLTFNQPSKMEIILELFSLSAGIVWGKSKGNA